MKRALATLIALLSSLAAALGATVTTKDGTVITGEIQGLAGGVYTVRTPYGTIKIPAVSVSNIKSDPTDAYPQLGARTSLKMAGSTTIGDELMPALIERYAVANGLSGGRWTAVGNDASEQDFSASGDGNRTFLAHISRHGSATAFTALTEGKADIGMASRPVNKDETAALRSAGFGAPDAVGQEHVLALDGLVVLVNRSNPIEHLSIAELGAIYSGEITDWQRVGGRPGAIHVLGRDAKSGSADTFKGVVLKTRKLASNVVPMDSSDGVSDKVASDPLAIGFAGFAYVRRAKALAIRTDCGLEVAPNDFFVRTEEYPLSRRLFLYTKAAREDDEPVQRFVAFALGHDGQQEANQKGFVDLLPRLSPPEYSGSRIALALGQVAQMSGDTSSDLRVLQTFNKIASAGRRMSVTFRFRTASFELDTRAVRDLDRVVAALKSAAMERRGLVVVGFSDAQGSPVRNLALAQRRAERVASLLRGKGVAPKLVVGLGRSAPVACNTTPEGLEKNRRVEIWLANPQN